MVAVIEAPIIFLFQSLVKQMFFVIAEAVSHRCSSRRIKRSTAIITAATCLYENVLVLRLFSFFSLKRGAHLKNST